jgi:CDP-diacylglycerol pyrophosphatase
MSVSSALAAILLAAIAFVFPTAAQIQCDCDPARPETMQARQCSLCAEAEKQTEEIFFLKDINPRKPNRWLALPKRHTADQHHLHDLSPAERTRLWTAAIQKAKELWGEEWGVAYNGAKVRTQCHAHIHIGKLLKGVETDRAVIVVSSPSQIPAPPFEGVWVHGFGKKMHVHLKEQTTETALMR